MIENPEVWINGGLASIAILELGVILYMLKMAYRLITNHMKHSDSIHKETISIMGELKQVIKANSRILDRVERKLDVNGFR